VQPTTPVWDPDFADPCVSTSDIRWRESGHPLVSVLIVNTNELHHLLECLPSVCRQTYPNYEVIVIDNCSSDGSVGYIREHFPEIRVEESRENLGYPGGNNRGMEIAQGDYFAILNPDTIVAEDWLEELVDSLETDPTAGLATSKILLMDDSDSINACGNVVTVTGLTFCRGVGKPGTSFDQPEEVTAVSGCSFLVRRSLIEEIGPFDADFVSYLEETDLSLRALLIGSKSIYVPTSKVLHNYAFRFNERKCFHIEKNRLYMLFKIFRPRTLFLMAPVLVMTEALVWGYVLTRGPRFLKQKWRGYTWLWRNRDRIRAEHRRVQEIRRVSDREILMLLVPGLPFDQVAGTVLARSLDRVTTPIMSAWSKLSLRLAN
jgi:GT2 family glycosyltransferase